MFHARMGITKDRNGEDLKEAKEIIGKTFSDVHCTNVFLGKSPKAIEIKQG